MAASLLWFRDHTQTHHTRQDCSRRVIGPLQRPLPENTHDIQETDIHAPGGIRTRNPNKRTAARIGLLSAFSLLLISTRILRAFPKYLT